MHLYIQNYTFFFIHDISICFHNYWIRSLSIRIRYTDLRFQDSDNRQSNFRQRIHRFNGVFFSTYNNFVAVGSTFIFWLVCFSEALLARRNASVVVLWKHTMVSAGLSLFGVAVGIGNIVVGADSDDGRWHLSGGSLVPAILVSHILKRFAIHMVNCPSVLDTFFVSQNWDSNLQFPSVKQIKEDVNPHSLVATI